MAPRTTTNKARENDYSNVGKAGRRTGVTIPEGRRDEFGLEEITGIFSSPRKPSPNKQNAALHNSTLEVSEEMDGMDSTGVEPMTIRSMRQNLRGPSLPRSASPKKSGITGTARRSDGLDLSPQKRMMAAEDRENTPLENTYPTPVGINAHVMRRFSPEKSPLKEVTSNRKTLPRSTTKQKGRQSEYQGQNYEQEDDVMGHAGSELIDPSIYEPNVQYEDNVVGIDDDEPVEEYLPSIHEIANSVEDDNAEAKLQSDVQQEDDQHSSTKPQASRKRKNDDFEDVVVNDGRTTASTQPNTKKARTAITKQQKAREDSAIYMESAESASSNGRPAQPKKKGRQVGAPKNPNLQISSRQQKQIDEVVERIASRPGKTKSLYILRRETPTDDSATHTRSGRVSVKPLAYWRNERCVYGEEGEVQEGSRFPLSTIKEIIRTEEVDVPAGKRGNSKSKRSKGKGKRQKSHHEDDGTDAGAEEEESDGEDAHAQPWELGSGIYQGSVTHWDQEMQRPLDETYDMDIAYAPSAIETCEVRNATFRYAKLFSTPFFGAGIVDLPPGGEKRPKNSTKMHMYFFVFEGRVDADVGGNKFSVGKGGMWQVPRGNSYSMRNHLEKPARIFFSQGCVTNEG